MVKLFVWVTLLYTVFKMLLTLVGELEVIMWLSIGPRVIINSVYTDFNNSNMQCILTLYNVKAYCTVRNCEIQNGQIKYMTRWMFNNDYSLHPLCNKGLTRNYIFKMQYSHLSDGCVHRRTLKIKNDHRYISRMHPGPCSV